MLSEKRIWKLFLVIGLIPFLFAIGFCFFSSLSSRWLPFLGYLFFYSCIYWPSYLFGIAFVILSLVIRRGKR